MKFAKQLEAESVSEWRRAYINYKGLKKRLKAIERYRKANDRAFRQQVENAVRSGDCTPARRRSSAVSQTTSVRYNNTTATERREDPSVHGIGIVPIRPVSNDSHPDLHHPTAPPKRSTTTPVDLEDYRQDQRDSLSRKVLQRISSALFHEETELTRLSHSHNGIENYAIDTVLTHASDTERFFFALLDQDLDKISRFYNEKEKEAETKLEVIKLQLGLVRHCRNQLTQMAHPNNEGIEQRLNPFHWFQPQQPLEVTNPTSDPTIVTNGEHHMSYRVNSSSPNILVEH
ncbi:hypothetical protein DM01DRAFT_1029619 [Hesseltinella vesiculosa]|uniref:SPX domain-containing protein n=1 Tax=Hesseltinella vesiculosa TaxID=101127 RepID=A0A1X2GJ33_9FUNG|nr:hypothetical protein DM01DRAFT_1029619 [Hesseltinella vesiculosa]